MLFIFNITMVFVFNLSRNYRLELPHPGIALSEFLLPDNQSWIWPITSLPVRSSFLALCCFLFHCPRTVVFLLYFLLSFLLLLSLLPISKDNYRNMRMLFWETCFSCPVATFYKSYCKEIDLFLQPLIPRIWYDIYMASWIIGINHKTSP